MRFSSGLLTASAGRSPTEREEYLYQRPDGGLSKVTPGKTSLKFVESYEQVRWVYRSRVKRALSGVAQALMLSVLLAAGTIYTV